MIEIQKSWGGLKISSFKSFPTNISHPIPFTFFSSLSHRNYSTVPILSTDKDKRDFLDKISISFGVKKLDDWYKINVSKFKEQGGTFILNRYHGNIQEMLQNIYPDHGWNFSTS